MFKRRVVPALLAVIALGALGACGSDDNDSSGSDTSGSVNTTTGSKTGTANTDPKKLGLLEIIAAAEVTARGAQAVKDAAKELNWSVDVVDPQGDPQKAVSGFNTMLTKGVDGVISAPWEANVLRQPLQKVKSDGTPVGVVWGEVNSKDGYGGYYAAADTDFGEASAEVLDKLKPKGGELAVLTSTAFYFGQARDKALEAYLADNKQWKVVAKHDTDYLDPYADTTKATEDILAAHPNLTAIWGDSSLHLPNVAAVLKKKGLCGKVTVVGFFDDLANLKAVRDGCVTSLVTFPLEESTWAAMDLMAGKLYSDKELPPTTPKTYPFDPNEITEVNKDNVPQDPKAHVAPNYDYKKYFTEKWAKGDYGAPS